MQFVCDLEKINKGWGKFAPRKRGLETLNRNKTFTGELFTDFN